MLQLLLAATLVAAEIPTTDPVASRRDTARVACAATVKKVDLVGWQEVQGAGFTFCAPAHWAVAAGMVSNGMTRFEWGVGDMPPSGAAERVEVVTEVVRVPAGADPRAYIENRRPPKLLPGAERRERTETIDGRRARVITSQFRGNHGAIGTWTTPRVWTRGRAQSADEAELLLTMIRTVRFAAPAP